MALVTRYVNTGSTPGGNGTTNDTAGANRAYASLNEWEAAEQTDLVTAGNYHEVHCEGSVADTTSVLIDGWTTGASNYILITVDQAVRHSGKWDTSKYRLDVTVTSLTHGIDVNEGFVRIDGLQVSITSASLNYRSVITNALVAATGDFRVSNCIIKRVSSGTDNNGGGISSGTNTLGTINCYFWNNLIYDIVNGTNAFTAIQSNTGKVVFAYNNTVQNCRTGYLKGVGNFTIKNCVAQNCNDGFSGTFTSATNNASDIASDAPGTNPQTGSVSFVDAAGDDFHLASNDTIAKDNGTSDPGSGLFSDDIDGVARTGSWDIGADEYVAAPSTVIQPKIMGRGITPVGFGNIKMIIVFTLILLGIGLSIFTANFSIQEWKQYQLFKKEFEEFKKIPMPEEQAKIIQAIINQTELNRRNVEMIVGFLNANIKK